MVCILESTCSEAYSPEKWDGYYIYIIYHGKNEETCYKGIKWRLLSNSFFVQCMVNIFNQHLHFLQWMLYALKKRRKQTITCMLRYSKFCNLKANSNFKWSHRQGYLSNSQNSFLLPTAYIVLLKKNIDTSNDHHFNNPTIYLWVSYD